MSGHLAEEQSIHLLVFCLLLPLPLPYLGHLDAVFSVSSYRFSQNIETEEVVEVCSAGNIRAELSSRKLWLS